MLTLQITDKDGAYRPAILDGPGGDIRISVGSPQDGRASVWRLTGSRSAGDVYLGNRDLMGFQKVSLHESGVFRFARTAERSFEITGDDSRVIDAWRRTGENKAGWTLAFRIWIVSEDVDFIGIPFGKQKSIDSILWLPKPPASHAIALDVMLVNPDLGEVELTRQRPVGGFWLKRKDGKPEACIVLATQLAVSVENRSWIDGVREEMNRRMRLVSTDQSAVTVRGVVYGHQNDGTRCIWDLSLRPAQ